MRFIIALFFVVLVPAQSTRNGPAGLAFPVPGAPLSFEQIEELTRTQPDGTTTTEVIKSRVYRDSAGRMRIEFDLPGPEPVPMISLVDPVAGWMVALLPQAKFAGRMTVPKNSGFAFNGMGVALPPGDWNTKSESLGKQVIEGIEFEGTRTTRTLGDLIAVDERWGSKELRLTGLAMTSGPSEKHTAKIQNVKREEPDPALFTVPSDYTIQELESPSQGQP